MFRRLHIQLTLFCTFVTGLILALMICVCLLISESGLRQQSRASFTSNLASLYQELESGSTISLEWLSQTSHNYGFFLRLTDRGVPLFYQQLSDDADDSVLFDAARATAVSQYGIDPDGSASLSNKLLHMEFPVKAERQNISGNPESSPAQNRQQRSENGLVWALHSWLPAAGADAWASAALIPKSSGVLGVIVLQPLTALSLHIWRQRLFFGAAGLAGLALLLLFSWYFTSRMLAPLEENRRRQTRFIAAASHELRSPLTVMLSCISAVKNKLVPDPDVYLDTVEAEGMRMSRLISDMLTLANADNHSWNIHPAPVELDTLLLQTWESFETLARARELKWEIRLPDEILPPCLCDGERIVQVLEILIDNAFSYVPAGCRICLSLEDSQCEKSPAGVFRTLLFTPLRGVNVTALRDAQKCCFRSISRRSPRDFCAKRTEITSRDSKGVNCNFRTYPLRKYANRISRVSAAKEHIKNRAQTNSAKERTKDRSQAGPAKEQNRSMFCICVSDNGPGIPDAQKAIVFERFQRLDDSRKDKSHFGLGLSIAREIILLHGGTLSLEDTPGGGATFRILLPG